MRPHPGGPGRAPDRTPGLPYRNPPIRFPRMLPIIGGMLAAGTALWYVMQPTKWGEGDTFGPWTLWKVCDPPPGDSTVDLVAHRMFGQTAGLGLVNSCQTNQAGYWDGVTINPGPPWTEATPGSVARTRNRLVIQFVGSLSIADRVHSRYNWWRSHTADTPGFPGPNTLYPQPGPFKEPGRTAPLPDDNWAPWQHGRAPWAIRPGFVSFNPTPAPIWRPFPYEAPLSPEMPQVGPAPVPKPKPETTPVPEIVEELFPEIPFVPVQPVGQIAFGPSRGHASRTNPRNSPRSRPPGRGVREKKARVGRVFGFLWNAVSPVTEGIEFIETMYECLPKYFKVNAFRANGGKQPTPNEKVALIYQHIDHLDIACALNNYVKNQLTDMIYAFGSDKMRDANRKDNRPIGYEAGGGLTGGGVVPELAPGSVSRPDWLPDFMPW